MPTIKDIAKEAGVSVTTVSNVIHNVNSHVAPETVERINKIIQKYRYTPNMSARALVNKSSKIISVINHLIPEQSGNFMLDPFHSAVIGGIEREVRERGYYMMIRTVEDENELMAFFRNWSMDGVIITGVFEDSFYKSLVKSDIPYVLLDSYIQDTSVLNIGLEDYKGGYIATKYLIDKGHTQIVFASPPIYKKGVIQERYRGYRDALNDAGIGFSPKNVYQQEINIDDGTRLGYELAKRLDVTAVFATADILAAGIMSGLHEKGIRIPDDVSIIGFDDLFLSRITSPQMTTVHQDADKRGVLAVDLLIDCLEKKKVEKNVVLPVQLIERSSVAALKKK
ncbi:MAG TPA: LacI family transcriptional regulator [Treponema sp.]|nr:LacI family transcriptional regulator [Treponema sp.]